MAPRFEAVAQKRGDMVIRKVNIMNWDSAVAKQFKIQSIPQVIVYDSDGKMVKRGNRESAMMDPLDGGDESSGGGGLFSSSWVIMFAVFAGVALVLFVLTKMLAPQKR